MSTPAEVTDAYRESFKYFKNYVSKAVSVNKSGRNKKVEQLFKRNGSNQNCNYDDTNGNNSPEDNPRETSDKTHVEEEVIILPYPIRPLAGEVIKREVSRAQINEGEVCHCYKMWGLRPPDTWRVVELTFPEGLIVIKNPFTPAGQRYWITRALLDFPHEREYVTNMDNLNRLEKIKRNEEVGSVKDFKLDTSCKDFYQKLRWVTFGYHHDWDTKIYSERMKSQFPTDLADMTRYISQVLQFSNFEAEASIANYYHLDSTLSGHVDRSEVNQRAPLFSLSFGQSAIFLIGGKTKVEVPQPVLLQSGDIAVMSGESRLSYHGVPKILPAEQEPWSFEYYYIKSNSISSTENDNKNNGAVCKRQKLEVLSSFAEHNCASFNETVRDKEVNRRISEMKWTKFTETYIRKSRINLNIRQVLFPGQTSLT